MTAGITAIPAPHSLWRARGDFAFKPRLIDRYLIGRTFGPMAAVLISTMVAFLMERILRSLELLAQTTHGFGYLVGLLVNLTPHYVGLTLPAGFFIALFVVVDRLNGGSEIDAMLASGMSLGRIAAPFVAMGLVMMMLSFALYGFIQPYARYGYRAVLHAASNAGWNGQVQAGALLTPDGKFLLTVDGVGPTGDRLERVFIRAIGDSGWEKVMTASSAEIRRNRDGKSVTLELHDGQQLITSPGGAANLLSFSELALRLPLAPDAKLLRSRGRGEETELTLFELARLGFGEQPPVIPRQTLLAELYSRLSRALALPLMPLLAVPLGLTAKRTGPKAALVMSGLLLFAFQTSLILGQGLAAKGALPAALAIGWPFGSFAAICILTFLSSRNRLGENPINWMAEHLSDVFSALRPASPADAER